jgi:hypothetical protein
VARTTVRQRVRPLAASTPSLRGARRRRRRAREGGGGVRPASSSSVASRVAHARALRELARHRQHGALALARVRVRLQRQRLMQLHNVALHSGLAPRPGVALHFKQQLRGQRPA